MSTSAPAVKAALVAACEVLFPAPALVSYGRPGTYQPDEIVAVMGQRTVNTRGAMSPARQREETVETVVVFSVYRPGDQSQQQDATERAYAMCDDLTEYLRTSPNEALGGACREARVTSHELVESAVTVPGDPSRVTGRTAEIEAVVTSTARV